MKKLKLNKERLTQLSNEESASIHGGGSAGSTNRNFTCCWCTSEPPQSETCSTQGSEPDLCPPGETGTGGGGTQQ